MVALHEARDDRSARGEDGALSPFRAPYTIAAQSAIGHAAVRAWELGDARVLPMHLLDVLLSHAPVREVLAAAGHDADRILASMQTWRDEDRRRHAAGASGHAYRMPAAGSSLVLESSDSFALVVDDGIVNVAPDKPVDSLALLLSLLAREIDERGLLAHWFGRPITPGPNSFMVANGVRWASTMAAVHKRRDALGRNADVPILLHREPADEDVVVLNDDVTPFEFVVKILREVVHLTEAQARFLTMAIDQRGEATIAHLGAEAAADLVTRIESRARTAGFPLVATVRPAR